jgi:hypothetical protein
MSPRHNDEDVLDQIHDRLHDIATELRIIQSVVMVKEPGTRETADAYDGLRKQVVTAAASRRSHLGQLAQMSTALSRATSLDDLRPQLEEWMQQAGLMALATVPEGHGAQELFEDVDGEGLTGATAIEVVEPAVIDNSNGSLVKLGRARRVAGGEPEGQIADQPKEQAT